MHNFSLCWFNYYGSTQPFNSPLSRTPQVDRYQKKHSPTHTHPDHQTSFVNFLHPLWSVASSVLNLHAWQSFSTIFLHVVFGLPQSSFFATHAHTSNCNKCLSCLFHSFFSSYITSLLATTELFVTNIFKRFLDKLSNIIFGSGITSCDWMVSGDFNCGLLMRNS